MSSRGTPPLFLSYFKMIYGAADSSHPSVPPTHPPLLLEADGYGERRQRRSGTKNRCVTAPSRMSLSLSLSLARSVDVLKSSPLGWRQTELIESRTTMLPVVAPRLLNSVLFAPPHFFF